MAWGQGMCVRQSSHKGAEKGRQTHEGKRDSLGSAFPPKPKGEAKPWTLKGDSVPGELLILLASTPTPQDITTANGLNV